MNSYPNRSPVTLLAKMLAFGMPILGGLWVLSYAALFIFGKDYLYSLTSDHLELFLLLLIGPVLALTGWLIPRN